MTSYFFQAFWMFLLAGLGERTGNTSTTKNMVVASFMLYSLFYNVSTPQQYKYWLLGADYISRWVVLLFPISSAPKSLMQHFVKRRSPWEHLGTSSGRLSLTSLSHTSSVAFTFRLDGCLVASRLWLLSSLFSFFRKQRLVHSLLLGQYRAFY